MRSGRGLWVGLMRELSLLLTQSRMEVGEGYIEEATWRERRWVKVGWQPDSGNGNGGILAVEL